MARAFEGEWFMGRSAERSSRDLKGETVAIDRITFSYLIDMIADPESMP
jgi:hypothetical protein